MNRPVPNRLNALSRDILTPQIFEFSTHEHESSAELDDNKKLDVLWKIVEMMEPNFEKLAKSLGS